MKNYRSAGFSIVEIILVLAVIAVLGFTSWTVYQRTAKPKTAQSVTTATPQPLTPEIVTTKIKDAFKQTYMLLDLQANNHPASGQLSVSITATSPVYRPQGYQYYVTYDGGSTVEALTPGMAEAALTLPTQVQRDVRQRAGQVLASLGLKKVSSTGNVKDGLGTDNWEGKGLTCQATALESATSSNTVGCGLIDRYPAAAETLKPFVAVYPMSSSDNVYLVPQIKDSQVSGYQSAAINTGAVTGGGGSVALFYRQTPGEWKYFKNVQDDLPCTEYNTVALKNAFKGATCYTAALVRSTVQ